MCRTKECAPTPVALTGTAVGTDVGLQLSTTGKLEALGPANRGSGDGACVGALLGVLLGALLAPSGPEMLPDSAGPEVPALDGTVGREWLFEFESPQAAATSRATMQTAATAATRLPRVALHFNAASVPTTRL